jgi:XTP/dITP diphosphohydrolase/tetrapyrrole methylase family protein/MazG family protein/ATP diphosphatase
VSATAALERLDEITRRLRRDCPWDREQDERSIVPHTVEEAYELADAARSADDAKMLDELGDVLFQVFFLALLLEERGAGDLGSVAQGMTAKLIRRHPHVFGEVEAESAGEVLSNWSEIKRAERGGELFGELPETLPATLYAKKLQTRAERSGLRETGEERDAVKAAARAGEGLTPELSESERFERAGDLLFAAVDAARASGVDPELALRAAADRFRGEHESGKRPI